MVLDELHAPVVLAPMAGGPSTPALAAAVSDAGGFGFLAFGYLSPTVASDLIAETRRQTGRPFGVNLFAPVQGPAEPAVYRAYVDRLEEWASQRGSDLGKPRFDDDGFDVKVELLVADPVAVVSFTFGCPPPAVIERLRSTGSEVWITVTNPAEAAEAASAGADALIVQGSEAGGHRASFADREDLQAHGLLTLLQLIGARERVDLVAAGGIATGGALAAVLSAGAEAAQIGTAFMLCPEAGTALPHRDALESDQETSLTRAFTGRLARGIRNAFMAEHGAAAPMAYPEIHHVTAPLRKAARESGDASLINLWAGETHRLARRAPAAEIVGDLASEARAALASASARLAR